MSNDEYRAEQAERREHGLKARHEQRLENATYTAAEVKVLTREAGEFGYRLGYRLGRRDAGEEIAQTISASALRFPDWQQRDVVYDMERLAREVCKGDPL